MEEKRKKSLFRYILIMFVVAFILVLISLVGQTHSIGQLSESSASALQRAEDLQTENRELTEKVTELETEIAALEAENQELRDSTQSTEPDPVLAAYEALIAGDMENVDPALLGPQGLELYENLTKEGNEE